MPVESVEHLAKFMDLEMTPDIIQKVVEKSRFKAMKEDVTANGGWESKGRHECSKPFLRKGIVSTE